jgi:hypothetical protein
MRRPTWIPWRDPARCDTTDCATAASHALVRLDASGSFAESLLRLACAAHGPAVEAEPDEVER